MCNSCPVQKASVPLATAQATVAICFWKDRGSQAGICKRPRTGQVWGRCCLHPEDGGFSGLVSESSFRWPGEYQLDSSRAEPVRGRQWLEGSPGPSPSWYYDSPGTRAGLSWLISPLPGLVGLAHPPLPPQPLQITCLAAPQPTVAVQVPLSLQPVSGW